MLCAPGTNLAAEDVDERRQHRGERDDDVVGPNGDPHRHLGPEHRDDAQFADAEAGQALEDAADAVVAEAFEPAAPGVAVVVPVAVDAGDSAVLGRLDAGRAELVVVVWQSRAAVGRDFGLFVTARAGLLVAQVGLEQEDGGGDERDAEQGVEDRCGDNKGEERAGDDERDRANHQGERELAVYQPVLDERQRGAGEPEGLADEADFHERLGVERLAGQQGENEDEERDKQRGAADTHRVDDGRTQEEKQEAPPVLKPVAGA